jgi:hypothetical protein
MNTLELCCLAVVTLWIALRFAAEAAASRTLLATRMVVIATAAWVTEDSCIRLYGFYGYNRDAWRVLIDEVPLLVLLIWPVVVTSALDLVAALDAPVLRDPRRLPAWLAVLVVVDAWFIEPIAVDAGLWAWTEPGPFHVPTIGVLGWGCFAFGMGVVFARGWHMLAALVVAPLVCHGLVLALWWGALRWLPDVPHPLIHPAAAWLLALGIVAVVVRRRPPGLRRLVWLRAPAAVFFFGLLWLHGRGDGDGPLVAWALAFAPPWLALLVCSSAASGATMTTSAARGA